jgi:uncharacterized membrane protein YfcA
MAALFLVLFLVTFLFHTWLGLAFLVIAIVMLYKSRTDTRVMQVRAQAPRPQPAWKDPWGTGTDQGTPRD